MRERRPVEVFPPGIYLMHELAARDWTVGEFAALTGWTMDRCMAVLVDHEPLEDGDAETISNVLGTSAAMWRNLERQYRLWKQQV